MSGIDTEVKDFVHSEVVVLVGSRGADLAPEAGFGWGPRVVEGDKEVEIFMDRAASQKTLANLRQNRAIAVTFTHPLTYKSIQLKGWCVEIGEASAEDMAYVTRHREAFTEVVRARGMPAHVTRTFWSREVVRVRFLVEELFNQTPGPRAGEKM